MDQVQRHRCNEVKDEALLEVGNSNLAVSDLGVILVFREAQELENDVQGEEKSHDVLQPKDPVVANVEHDCSEVHRCEAGVDDND